MTVTAALALGLPVTLERYVGEFVGSGNGGAVLGMSRWAWKIEIFAAAAACALMTGAGMLGANPRSAWVLAGLTAAASVMHAVPSAVLRGLQRWREARIIGMVTADLPRGIKIVALGRGGGIPALFAIDAAIVACNLIGTTMFARRAIDALPPEDRKTGGFGGIVKFAAIALIGFLISLVVYQRTEVFFPARYSTDPEIAIYAIPFSIVSALLLLPWAIAYALAPAVATLWGAGEVNRIRSGFSRATRLILLLTLVMTGLAVALLPAAIRLVHGSAFAGAGRVLVILVSTLPFVPLAMLCSSFLLAIGRQWGLTIFGTVAAVLSIGLDLLLIPHFGAVGVAIANSVAQVAGSIPLIIYAIRVIGGVSLHVGALLRATGMVLCAVLAPAFAIHVLPLTVGLVAGTILFAVTLAVVGAVVHPLTTDDGLWVEAIVGTRAHGIIGATSRYASGRGPLAWGSARS